MFAVPLRRRVGVIAALAVVGALFTPAASLLAASPVEALEPFPRDYATWHEYQPATAGGSPASVMVDAGDTVWYADGPSNQIVKVPSVAPASHVAFDLGTSVPGITSLLMAPDGTIWFSDSTNAAMGRLDPATGSVTSYPLGGAFDWAASPVVGPDGAIWFGWADAGGLGRIALDGTITAFPEPARAQAYHLTAAEDGRIWFTRDGYGSLGAFDPASGVFDVYPIGVGNFSGLTVARDGALWAAGANLLEKVSLTGAVLDTVAIPAAPFEYISPTSLAAGVDQELYFVAGDRGIGIIDYTGRLTFTKPPFAHTSITSLAVTSYNSVWYTDTGRLSLGNS